MRLNISNKIFRTEFVLPIISVTSLLVVIIVTTTDENQLIISITDSFAKVLDRNIITISGFLKTSSLQSSSQQDSIVNRSSLNKIYSSFYISHSTSNNNVKLPEIRDPNLTIEVVVDGLNMPTTMAFLDKGDFLILQKNGSLVRIVDGVLADKTRLNVPVSKGFYQGLLGIAITNQNITTKNNGTYVFLYYTVVANNNIIGTQRAQLLTVIVVHIF